MNNLAEPLVSVCMITYNHEKYISKAIEGVLMQQTDFKIEFVIGEDCSSDSTYDICVQYALRYPETIRILHTDRNMGMIPNFVRTLKACNGKYIALCEGDDYWTDPYKLQKQVNFLEAHPEFAFCHHAFDVLNQRKSNYNLLNLERKNIVPPNNITDLKYYLSNKNIKTLTIVFRKILIDLNQVQQIFSKKPYISSGDYCLFLLLLIKGNGYFLNERMGVYRLHDGGITFVKRDKIDQIILILLRIYDWIPDEDKKGIVKKRLIRSAIEGISNFRIKNAIRIFFKLSIRELFSYCKIILSYLIKKKIYSKDAA